MRLFFIRTLKNSARRSKAQRLTSGSGVPMAGGAGAVAPRCSVKASRGWAGDPRAAPGAVAPPAPCFTGSRVHPAAVSRRADAARGRDRRAGEQHSTCAPGVSRLVCSAEGAGP